MVMLYVFSVMLATLCVSGAPYGRTLVLGGGSIEDSNTEIWNKIIALAGGRGVARVGIITAANENAVTTGRTYKVLFESYGVREAYWVPIYEDNKGGAYEKAVVDNINRMTAIFFGGGAQQRIIETMLDRNRKPTPAMAAIQALYNNGTVVAGTSAGAMVMPSTVTMVSGTSYSGILNGAIKVSDAETDNDLTFDDEGGIGFISSHTVDSHFHERGRQGRLIRMMSDTRNGSRGTDFGLGIDENTILVVTDVGSPEEMGEVYGSGGVMIVDLSKSIVDTKSQSFRLLGIYVDYVTAGDRVNMADHVITPAPIKVPLKGNETSDYAMTSDRIFRTSLTADSSDFYLVSSSLFKSRFDSITYGTTVNGNPTYYVIMREDSRSAGYLAAGSRSSQVSYTRLKVELRGL